MIKKTALAGLALTALALTGCSGGGASAPSASAPASAQASSAAAPTPAESTPAASPSASTAAADVKDPCAILDAGQVEDLTGVKVKKGTTQSVGSSKVCTWLPQDGTKSDAAVFSGQEGELNGSLSQVESQLKTQFAGKVSKVDVAGAEDARYVVGKKSGLNIIDVIAQRGDIFYQVLAASPRDAEQHKGAAVKMAEALLKA